MASVGASRGTVRGAPTSRSTTVWSRVGGPQLPTCAGRRNFASLGRAPSHWLPMVCAVNRLMQISSWAMRGLLWWWCGISWCISSALCIRTFCLLTDIGNVCRTEFWSIGSLVIALVSDYTIASETFLVWLITANVWCQPSGRVSEMFPIHKEHPSAHAWFGCSIILRNLTNSQVGDPFKLQQKLSEERCY